MTTEAKVGLYTGTVQPHPPAPRFIRSQGQASGRPVVHFVYQPVEEGRTARVVGRHHTDEDNSQNRTQIDRSQENIRVITTLRDFRNEWNVVKEKTSSMSNIIKVIGVFYLAEKIIPFVGNIFGSTFLVIFLLLIGAVIFLKYKDKMSAIVQKGRDFLPRWNNVKSFFSVEAEDRNSLGRLAGVRV